MSDSDPVGLLALCYVVLFPAAVAWYVHGVLWGIAGLVYMVALVEFGFRLTDTDPDA